jgi:hypothetical protein
MPRLAILTLGVVLIGACDNGPSCYAATCAAISCVCPVSYKGCVDGVCATTCPATGLSGGQACGYDCECASGQCALDSETCCAVQGNVGSGQACQSDCDCAGQQCGGGTCT